MESIGVRSRVNAARFCSTIFLLLTIATAAGAQSEIPFDVVHHIPRITLTVEHKPLRMVVDTGAERTVLRRCIGPTSSTMEMQNAANTSWNRVRTNQVEVIIGPRKFTLTAICGVELPSGEDGLLGEDFLRMFEAVTVDYARQTVTLTGASHAPN